MQQEDQSTTVLAREPEGLTDFDLHLFTEGSHVRLFEKMGAHCGRRGEVQGAYFAVWAPNAQRVSVVGNFNHWAPEANVLEMQTGPGVWAGFVPGVKPGDNYQYHVVSSHQGLTRFHADPFGFQQQGPPRHASVVWDLHYSWKDDNWLALRAQRNSAEAPISIYQVELNSWMRVPEEGNRPLTYRELAPKLAEYATRLGFTHVELMRSPATIQPRDGYFAPDSRFGAPQDLMGLVDTLHQRGLGVLLDWSLACFPPEEQGLAYFDGTHLYEHGPWQLTLPGGRTGYAFDLDRPEVRSFLLSSAFFWLHAYHFDGLRLGDLETVLQFDFGRRPGEWVPNRNGGRENLEGAKFLRHLNTELSRTFPDALLAAQETTSWPLVTQPPRNGGLGFSLKWDSGFTESTLEYFSHDPVLRRLHHETLTFRGLYAFSENFLLPLSGQCIQRRRRSLLAGMPGDSWQRLANLRLLFAYLFLQPGKKLLFMGNEFAQWQEWQLDASLDWHLCAYPQHASMQHWVGDLNALYRAEKGLHQGDFAAAGFQWVDYLDAERSTLSWLRRDPHRREVLLVACNFTPVVRHNFRLGVRRSGHWKELLNSDAKEYGGSGQGNFGGLATVPLPSHNFPHTLTITLPPLAAVVFKHADAQ